jgi:hypothetical protein
VQVLQGVSYKYIKYGHELTCGRIEGVEELGFWAENAHWEYDWWELTLDIERKMGVGGLGKCLKVGKLTKICAKLTKSGSVAR